MEPLKPVAAPRRVLVTGAGGYVGANTVARLLSDPAVAEVCAAVRTDEAARTVRGWFPGQSRLRLAVGELPSRPWDLHGLDTVVHAAAWISLRASSGPAARFDEINAAGTRSLLEDARAAGVSRFVFLSSQAAYGVSRPPPWTEDSPLAPETDYARSKVAAEQACLEQSAGGVPVVILRLARVYGAGLAMRWEEVLPKFALLTASGRPMTVHGGGRERVDLVHIRDVTEAIARAATRPALPSPLVLNIGGGATRSILELAETFRSQARGLGLTPPALDHQAAASTTVRQWGMELSRAAACLGWKPAVFTEEGIVELLQLALARPASPDAGYTPAPAP